MGNYFCSLYISKFAHLEFYPESVDEASDTRHADNIDCYLVAGGYGNGGFHAITPVNELGSNENPGYTQ